MRSTTGTQQHHYGFGTECNTAHVKFSLFVVTVRLRALPRRSRGRARQAHLHGGDVQQRRSHRSTLCHVLRPVVSGRRCAHDKVLLICSFIYLSRLKLDTAALMMQLRVRAIASIEVSARKSYIPLLLVSHLAFLPPPV